MSAITAQTVNELRQRTDDLTEALEQQTATSEVIESVERISEDPAQRLREQLAAPGYRCRSIALGQSTYTSACPR
mgnify:CR=1 FL=1